MRIADIQKARKRADELSDQQQLLAVLRAKAAKPDKHYCVFYIHFTPEGGGNLERRSWQLEADFALLDSLSAKVSRQINQLRQELVELGVEI